MAKARKPKSEEQKPESSGAVVRHQKLCLSVDTENKRLYGYTELKISPPESGMVELHADNMTIESILVDGEPAAFEFFPHYQHVEDEKRWKSVNCTAAAADAASTSYLSSLDKEMAPNLLILCSKKVNLSTENQSRDAAEERTQPSLGDKNEKLVRIDYWVEKAETGIHFRDNIVHTDNQIRRAHCWFPCIDSSSQRCCYDLEFTVDHKLVAVSNGDLLYQVLSKDDPPRKTYVYSMSVPVTAECISLAVGPFEIFPDRQNAMITHLCLTSNLSRLRHTVGFFFNVYSYFEEYLSASFPFGSYKQVFLTPEMTISSVSLGASMCIFSSQVLFDEKVIDQTIDTRIKLAFALARQWFGVYITAETPNDEWLLDGLAGFLSDLYIKRFLGNNEARYRRYKANCVVCKADFDGATALSSSAASTELYGTQRLGLIGKIRSWKAVSVLEMLEKQMGPESFRKILQTIISNAKDPIRPSRTLSTKEFRHLANKVGNLERPFLKEFFPRWVGSCGCPVLRMGLSYNKRRNMMELAVLRGCTAAAESTVAIFRDNLETDPRGGDVGWPGMMSIRVHELDGMYDHPSLPMAGDTWQLLELQCHSKLAAKRIQRPKKGSKPDGSDDNGDATSAVDIRSGLESPLLWVRVDPEMEYLAEIHFHQPVQMWINQLEKDKDVVAQSQAIETLQMLPQLSFAVVNALNNFLNDSKGFWRVRVEAAFALAHTASEETDWAGMQHLIKFYKSRRFDPNISLPKPNDFHDFPEYFVLEAIPHAIARVRSAHNKSPKEAVEFVLQLLKYNDNSGNPYSDVYWLSALVQSIGELEFGQQSVLSFLSLLKRIDRLLQFDRLMPSYNGILTLNCIRTLTQIALKLSVAVPLDRVVELIRPFQNVALWQIRIEASRALLDLEFHGKGLDDALILFMQFIDKEPSLRGQVKLARHVLRMCQSICAFGSCDTVKSTTLIGLLRHLGCLKAFNNVFLRHQLFCILHTLAGRPPTLYGVPRVAVHPMPDPESCSEPQIRPSMLKLKISKPQDPPPPELTVISLEACHSAETNKEAEAVSNGTERRLPVVKIRVKQNSIIPRVDTEHLMENSQGRPIEVDLAGSSSASVDAPVRIMSEPVSISNHNVEEVNSSHDHGSRMTASVGSAKFVKEEDIGKELQCTADSKGVVLVDSKRVALEDRSSPSTKNDDVEREAEGYAAMHADTVQVNNPSRSSDMHGSMEINCLQQKSDLKVKVKKKEKEGKRKRDDAEYLERKRLKKEKRRSEKEKAKLGNKEANRGENVSAAVASVQYAKLQTTNPAAVEHRPTNVAETKVEASEVGSSLPKIRLKFKGRNIISQSQRDL
ncbi:Transcription initiation factor TFIID subunit 2 [Nymphaea thermarum]|nr:Transcription initiation factor TFIID subunit 2 [Nymphaea thermarum]